MTDPDAQGWLLLSFIAERHQRQGRKIAAKSRPAAWRRLLMNIGGELIDIGTRIRDYGQPAYGPAVIDIPLEAK
ncbi:MAG: hypothetical protein KC410_02725 [Anaerolineales bacterium]|uniref:hypothetical protein n=1 Tax=Promineifilum sp. TaxID=2664178 RepID=UPI001DEE3E28|nr:hypothetical protein [Anaerolineales bacterium]MCO5178489.1 hypothetical protein [Promineifilum sp.]